MLGGNWLPIPKKYCKYTNKQKLKYYKAVQSSAF